MTENLTGGVNVLTGEACEISDSTVAAPQSVIVVEYKNPII